MASLYNTSAALAPVAPIQSTAPVAACNASDVYQYQAALKAWNACQECGRAGFGAVQNSDGSWRCDTSQQKAGALQSCPAGPVNPCFPMMRPLDPLNPWAQEQPHSWGASVYDPNYGTNILWGTYDPERGRPYFASEAPFLRAGRNVPCHQ